MHGKFRLKPILILVVCFTLAGVGWFFLHRFQMKAMHSRFLTQATRAEEANPPDYARAARFFRIYLLANGTDTNALARYGTLLDKHSPPSYQARNEILGIYEKVLAQDPTRKEILMRAANLSYGLGRTDNALRHLDSLKQLDPLDPAVELFQGICKQDRKESNKEKLKVQWRDAEDHYRKAISLAPDKLEPYVRLADLLRNHQKKLLEAIKVLEDLIKANPRSALAHAVMAEFRQTGGDEIMQLEPRPLLAQGPHLSISLLLAPELARGLCGAEQDFSIARQLAPDNANVLLVSAVQELLWAQQKGVSNPASHLEKARDYLRHGEKLHPKDARFLSQFAAVERVAGRPDKAIHYLRIAQTKASGDERNRLLWDLVNLLIDGDIAKTLPEAQQMIEQLKKNREETARLEFLDARIMIRQGQWHKAVGLLQTARPMLASYPALVTQVDLLMGMCFEQLGNADLQVTTYQRARRDDPLSPAPRFGLAMALLSLGRLDEAITECEELRSMPQSAAGAEFLYVRLLIIKNLRLPAGKRDWSGVNRTLDELEKLDDSTKREVRFLRAEIATQQKQYDQAKEILNEIRDEWPEQIEPWISLANLEPESQEGLNILEEAIATFGDRPELRLAKLHPRYVPMKNEDALAYLRSLNENLERFNRANQVRLLVSLAEAFERVKDLPAAEQLWQKLVQLEPNQLRVRLVLFDFYLRTNNDKGMERELESIKRIEGSDQPLGNYGQAQVELFRAGERMRRLGKAADQLLPDEKELTKVEKDYLSNARICLNSAQAKRPKWSRIPVSLASIAELEGNSTMTTKHLNDAVDLGNRQLNVIKALVMRLQDNRQYLEAQRVLEKLLEVAPITDIGLQKQAAEISIYNQNADRALELTLRAVSKESSDYKDYLWQGQMLGVLNQHEKAEDSLRSAIKLGGDDPSPWVALIQLFQTRMGDPKRAKIELEKMKLKIPAAKLRLALAHCYQIMGETVEAQRAYVAALEGQPDQPALKSAATFYLGTGNTKDAEKTLRQMLDPKWNASEDERAWARRNLAMALWFQDDPEKQTQAMRLIEENLKTRRVTNLDDQMAKGTMLATKMESRDEAIKILEKAFSFREPTPDQMFALANLYDAAGDWRKCRGTMVKLLSTNSKHEKYRRFLSAYVDKLMTHEDTRDADEWLDRLQESIEEHLTRQQSEPLADRLSLDTYLLAELARRHPRLASKILPSGVTLKKVAAKTDGKESLLAIAEFLACCQCLEESLDFCEKALKDLPPQQVLAVAVTAIATNKASDEQMQRVEKLLISARQQKPKLRELDVYLAVVKERGSNYREAEELYRSALKEVPGSIMVLNNLAFLIGLQGKDKGTEAIALIDKAINKVGPGSELLDSRAAILRVQGPDRLPEAEKDIREAIRQQKTPSRLFHLAQILQSGGNAKESMNEFREAERLGLRIEMLHPLEIASYRAFLDLSKKK